MELGNKRPPCSILSPRPLTLRQLKPKPNPFFNNPLCPDCLDLETVVTELQTILNNQTSPQSKKSSSPFCFRNRPPTRQHINPIIFDEKFIGIDSSTSTCEDSLSSTIEVEIAKAVFTEVDYKL